MEIKDLNLKDFHLEEAKRIVSLIDLELESVGLSVLNEKDSQEKELYLLSIKKIREFNRTALKNLLIDLELVHPKLNKSQEYQNLEKLIKKGVSLEEETASIIKKTDAILKENFKKAVNSVDNQIDELNLRKELKENNFISFSDFKGLIEDFYGDDVLVEKVLSIGERPTEFHDRVFNLMKQVVISRKAGLENLPDEVMIEDIKDQKVAYELVRREAFQSFWRENFSVSIPDGKIDYLNIVRAVEPLGVDLSLEKDEIGILSIGLNSPKNFNKKIGDVISSNVHYLDFEITTEQSYIKENIRVSHLVNIEKSIFIVVPVYMSLQKGKLRKK